MNFHEKYIGCSGFFYKDWKGKFYPEDVPQRLWLEYYAGEFNSVELNNTFYRLPKDSTFERWYERTPADFRFAVKGSRYITHVKRLKEPEEAMKRFYHGIALLNEKTGCVLWQLPPSMKKDMERLRTFCQACSKEFENVIEFRDISWFTEEVYDLLKEEQVAFCMISAPGNLPEEVLQTDGTVYLRFHGKDHWYNYYYSKEELTNWAHQLAPLKAEKAFVFFNNDYNANAIKNARQFQQLID